ncbi:hypothetical protein D3C76_56080 [compost metagenome]
MTEPCLRKSSRQHSCMRQVGQDMRYEVQVDSAERRLKPPSWEGMPKDMPRG